jgi:hypothetical protein
MADSTLTWKTSERKVAMTVLIATTTAIDDNQRNSLGTASDRSLGALIADSSPTTGHQAESGIQLTRTLTPENPHRPRTAMASAAAELTTLAASRCVSPPGDTL